LILVEKPYFNEPGYQASEGTPQGIQASDRYNQKIRSYTLDAAVLPHLTRLAGTTPSMFPEFDDVIEKHFHLKERALKMQLSEWRQYRTNESINPNLCMPGYVPPPYIAANTGPKMETLYLSCITAIECWPKKQKARKNKNDYSAFSALLDEGSNPVVAQPIHAKEVNGVIEIDLDDDDDIIDEAAAPASLPPPPSNAQPGIAIEVDLDDDIEGVAAPTNLPLASDLIAFDFDFDRNDGGADASTSPALASHSQSAGAIPLRLLMVDPPPAMNRSTPDVIDLT